MGQEDKREGTIIDPMNVVPVLPLRDVVVYPHMVIPLFVGREKSIKALDAAMADNKQILLVAQKSADVDEPQPKDMYDIGTLASILQLLKLPDGTVKVLVEGGERAHLVRFVDTGDFFTAELTPMPAGKSASGASGCASPARRRQLAPKRAAR